MGLTQNVTPIIFFGARAGFYCKRFRDLTLSQFFLCH